MVVICPLVLRLTLLQLKNATSFLYSYFEKGCQKKCSRQSRKVLWVALRALFQRNLKEWRGRPWRYVCEYYRKATKVGSTASVVTNSVLIISHITFRDCHVRISSDNLSRNSCILAHLSVSLRGMVYTCQEESLHIYYIVTPEHLVLQVPVQFIQNTIKTDEESMIFLCQT